MIEKGKIVTIKQAVDMIPSGSHISIGGFSNQLLPMAIVREIIRQKKDNFELSSMGEGWAGDMLIGAGCLKKLRLSCFLIEGYGRCYNFVRAVENKEIEIEDYSHFGITLRFYAGALGIPFIPSRVMIGSDIHKIKSFDRDALKIIKSPFTGEKILLIAPLKPDIAIIHASRADKYGNIQLFGSEMIIDEIARAAKKVIVSVEEIVCDEEIRKHPKYTIIPSFLVDAIIKIPFGAHPSGVYKYYDYDDKHINYYIKSSKNKDDFKKYLNEFIYETRDHFDYLEKIGIKKLMELRSDPTLGFSLANRRDIYEYE